MYAGSWASEAACAFAANPARRRSRSAVSAIAWRTALARVTPRRGARSRRARAAPPAPGATTQAAATLTIDEDVLRAVRVRTARLGRRDSDVIEDAVRQQLGLDLLRRAWDAADLGEDEATELAVEAQHATRPLR